MRELRVIEAEELKRILAEHEKWLESGGKDGAIADLSEAALRGANLEEVDLRYADLSGADLYRANLIHADLYRANLIHADLRGADLTGAELENADLSGADLYRANLIHADLYRANLIHADLRGADLTGAELENANLYEADLMEATYFIPSVCPEKGSFIGWKKAWTQNLYWKFLVIVKLLIPEDALRSSGTGRKCRASKATVIDIQSLSGESLTDTKASSLYDRNFIYETGMTIEPDSFDRNRFNECSHGIHFFIDRQEAVYYES